MASVLVGVDEQSSCWLSGGRGAEAVVVRRQGGGGATDGKDGVGERCCDGKGREGLVVTREGGTDERERDLGFFFFFFYGLPVNQVTGCKMSNLIFLERATI